MVRTVLILGAGRSSSSLIQYLLRYARNSDLVIRVGDADLEVARMKLEGHSSGQAFALDAGDEKLVESEISKADLVISMLPADMHPKIAVHCIQHNKHLITPSYISPAMRELDLAAKSKDILLLNEMGVDPGIDHMSAMKIMDHIRSQGGELQSFESFTGGLVAPESDDNPWHYKITWNPRNVVLAGAGGQARFLENGKLRFIPYHKLFTRITPVHIDGYGDFEGYANRDSLTYRSLYNIANIPTLFRGTLRKSGFCSAWNLLVQLGMTDDNIQMENMEKMTWKELTASFLPNVSGKSTEEILQAELAADAASIERLRWLGIFDDAVIGIRSGTPAQALQKLIEVKWKLNSGDKDMIVMWHRFGYILKGKKSEIRSSMVCVGDDPVYTAMAKTVGLPIAISAKMILENKVKLRGVQLPIMPELYEPILSELSTFGITFTENQKDIS